MTLSIRGFAAGLGRAALVALAAIALAACGSGAVTDNTPVSTGPLAVTPSTATLFSETPSTFIITGGTPPYTVTSSNQQVIPFAGTATNGTVTVSPNPVSVETPVTLTIRDSAGATPVTATATVRPRTVSNVVTVIPSPGQPESCGTSVCAGGDAEVRVGLSQNGLPLTQRSVLFEVTSGDVRFITSPPGLPETLSSTATATTDSGGIASVRVRALNNAGIQTALLRIVDSASGFSQRASVSVTRADAPLNAQPSTLTFKGVAADTCASGVSADVIVFGGLPPYQISQPTAFVVSPIVIDRNGGRFTVTATGQCTTATQIAVVDSVGRTVTVTASNQLSDATPPSALSVSPTLVSLGSCNDSATVALIGGSGTYFAASGNSGVNASASGATGVIRRVDGPAPNTTSVQVAFSDGSTSRTVTVELNGEAAGACPAPSGPSSGLTASPASVTLTDCTTNQSFRVTGGTGAYVSLQNGNAFTHSSVSSSSGTTYFVRRATGSAAPPSSPQQSLTVSDGNLQVTVPINFSGAGAGAC